MEDAGIKPPKKDSNIIAALPYIFGILVALLVYLLAKDDKFARYHALQSLLLDIVIIPVFFIEYILAFVLLITVIGYLVMWFVILGTIICVFLFRLYMAYNAFQGRSLMIPYLGKAVLNYI